MCLDFHYTSDYNLAKKRDTLKNFTFRIAVCAYWLFFVIMLIDIYAFIALCCLFVDGYPDEKLMFILSKVKTLLECLFWITTQIGVNEHCIYYEEGGHIFRLANEGSFLADYFTDILPIGLLIYFGFAFIGCSMVCCCGRDDDEAKDNLKMGLFIGVAVAVITVLIYYYILIFKSAYSIPLIGLIIEEFSSNVLGILLCCALR